MNFKILLSRRFEREAKALTKKYPSLKEELAGLLNELKDGPDKEPIELLSNIEL